MAVTNWWSFIPFFGGNSNEEVIDNEDDDLILNVIHKPAKDETSELNHENSTDIHSGLNELSNTIYTRYTVTNLENALNEATRLDKHYPSWVRLFEIFDNVLTDTHVNACVKTIRERLKSKDFYIDVNGEKREDLKELFEKDWFNKFIDIQINARLYGFSLFEINEISNGNISKVSEVNRRHVRPDLEGIVKQEYDTKVKIKFNRRKNIIYTIPNNERRIGELLPISYMYIAKRESLATWLKTNAIYGIVPLIGKTELKDNNRRKKMINFFKNYMNNIWGIVDKDDEIDTVDVSRQNIKDMFEELLKYCNKEMSKSFLGSTMVLDDGSSRSQAEVHENQTDMFIMSYAREIYYTINDKLIPVMRNLGISIPHGAKFKWDNSETLDKEVFAKIVSMLSSNFELDEEEISEKLGVKVKLKHNSKSEEVDKEYGEKSI